MGVRVSMSLIEGTAEMVWSNMGYEGNWKSLPIHILCPLCFTKVPDMSTCRVKSLS